MVAISKNIKTNNVFTSDIYQCKSGVWLNIRIKGGEVYT